MSTLNQNLKDLAISLNENNIEEEEKARAAKKAKLIEKKIQRLRSRRYKQNKSVCEVDHDSIKLPLNLIGKKVEVTEKERKQNPYKAKLDSRINEDLAQFLRQSRLLAGNNTSNHSEVESRYSSELSSKKLQKQELERLNQEGNNGEEDCEVNHQTMNKEQVIRSYMNTPENEEDYIDRHNLNKVFKSKNELTALNTSESSLIMNYSTKKLSNSTKK